MYSLVSVLVYGLGGLIFLVYSCFVTFSLVLLFRNVGDCCLCLFGGIVPVSNCGSGLFGCNVLSYNLVSGSGGLMFSAYSGDVPCHWFSVQGYSGLLFWFILVIVSVSSSGFIQILLRFLFE